MSLNTYKPFLDYGLTPNQAVIFPTVIENYDWGIFVKNISKKYYQALSDFREKENKSMEKLFIHKCEQEPFFRFYCSRSDVTSERTVYAD